MLFWLPPPMCRCSRRARWSWWRPSTSCPAGPIRAGPDQDRRRLVRARARLGAHRRRRALRARGQARRRPRARRPVPARPRRLDRAGVARRGIPPALQLRVFAQVAMIDACLTPVAVVVAGAGGVLDEHAVIAIVPLLVLRRLRARPARTDRRAHDPHPRAAGRAPPARRLRIRRVGEASGAGLDRPALLEVVLRTAMEALGADRGRARAAGSETEAGGDAVPPAPALERAMRAAEARARETGRPAADAEGGSFAVAHPLTRESGAGAAGDVVVLGRGGRAVRRGGAGPLRLPRRADVGGDGERRPARAAVARSARGRADRPRGTIGTSRRCSPPRPSGCAGSAAPSPSC